MSSHCPQLGTRALQWTSERRNLELMDPRVYSTMAGQHGFVTRRQLRAIGVDDEAVRRWLASGEVVAVRRGVYFQKDVWDGLDEYVGKPLARARAAHYGLRLDHVMSHDSAALEHGMPILGARPEMIHVTRPRVLGTRSEHGVKHHKAVFLPDQRIVVNGIPVLDRARTAVDIAREHGFRHGAVACDSAMRAGVTRRELELAVEPMWCWPGVTAAREAVDFADPRAESVAETLGRDLVCELGLGDVEPQFEVVIDGRTYFCDLRVGRHVFEVDGRIKYQSVETGGVSLKSAEQVVWDEKQRQTTICGIGLGMSRIVWADYFGQRQAAKARLRREYAVTEARFGTSLDGLEPYLPMRRAG